MQTILVVDADAPILRDLQVELRSRFPDAQVIPALDGKEALDILRASQVDLILTDLHMPEMDGITLLCHIMDEYPHLPCVLLTSLPEAVKNYSRRTGALAILDKRNAVSELASEVETWLRDFSAHTYSAALALSYLVQLIKLESRDCEVGMQDPATGLLGILRFKKGQLVDAIAGDFPPHKAAVFLLSRPCVRVWINDGEVDDHVRLEHPLETFLTQATAILDDETDPFSHLADATAESTQADEIRVEEGAPTPVTASSAPNKKVLLVPVLLLVGTLILIGAAYAVITANRNHAAPVPPKTAALTALVKPEATPVPPKTAAPAVPVKPEAASALAPNDIMPATDKEEIKRVRGIPDINQQSRLALLISQTVKRYAALLTDGVVATRKEQFLESLGETVEEIEQMYEKLSQESAAVDDPDLASAVDSCRERWGKMAVILGEKPTIPGFKKMLYLSDVIGVENEVLTQRLTQQYDHRSSPQENAANEIGVRVTELTSAYLAASMDIDRKKHTDEIMSTIMRVNQLLLGLEHAPDNTGQIRGIIRSCTGMEWRHIRQCMSECADEGKVEFKGLKMIVFSDVLSQKTERLALLYEKLDKELNAQ